MTAPPRRADGRPQLSIVIPMLDEAGNLPALFARLFAVLDGCGESFEVLAVDDGSTDATLAALMAQRRARPELRIVSFARNFGQHAAVMAGFEAARGEWIVTLDADLQNPPEEIPRLLDAFRAGHDLVNTWREGREDPSFRKLASRLVNRFMRRASGIALRDFGCMLRGYHRRVVTPMVRRREYHTFIPALAMLHARDPAEIAVRHAARERGRSNYSLRRLFSLQLDLITSFSIAPLRLLFLLGSAIAALGSLFGVFLLVMRVVRGPDWAVSGVFTLFAVLFILVGAQFVAFGLLGEYIGRIYQEVRQRPPYLVRDLPPDETHAGPRAEREAGEATARGQSPPRAADPGDAAAQTSGVAGRRRVPS